MSEFPFNVSTVRYSFNLSETAQILVWLYRNVDSRLGIKYDIEYSGYDLIAVCFLHSEDAVLFRLRFGL